MKFEDKLDINSTEATTGKTEIENILLDTIALVKSDTPIADLEADYEFARNKLLYAFERTIEILDNATRLVRIDPTPRSIEAASAIFKTLNDNSKELLNLHKNKNKILKELNEVDATTKLDLVKSGNVSDILKEES